MKRTIAAVAASIAILQASAEGYQVNTLSAKQIGMGHTGVAMHLGAESMFFNPAGLGFLDKTVDVSASVCGIMPKATATVDGVDYKTANDISTPMMVNVGFSIYDNFKAGVSFYTPYGSKIDWTDNWPGAVLNQSVSLQVFSIQPTLSWQPIKGLSIGAGLTVSWGSVDLNKGLVTAATADKLLGLMQMTGQIRDPQFYGTTTPASVNLKGTANVVCGFNVGAMWDINSRWTVGASMRSRLTMKVDAGTASLRYADEQAKQVLSSIDVLNSSRFTAEMPCPMVFSFGVSYKPIDRLILAADARLTGWKTYKQLDIEFLDERLESFNQHIEKKYKNSWAVSLGAQYNLTDRLDLRAGLMVDTSPVDIDHYNPETPGMTKIEPTVGLSFRPVKNLSVDLGFMYIAGLGVDNATCTYDDLLAKTINGMVPTMSLPETVEFKADYKVHAFSPSIGVSYSF